MACVLKVDHQQQIQCRQEDQASHQRIYLQQTHARTFLAVPAEASLFPQGSEDGDMVMVCEYGNNIVDIIYDNGRSGSEVVVNRVS